MLYVVRGRPGQNDRPALPAGHPTTWGLITAGTILEGSAYPVRMTRAEPSAAMRAQHKSRASAELSVR